MPNVKTAISLQESLFERADALARELKISRSRLFSLAVDDFVRRHESQALLEAINRAYDDLPDPEKKARQHGMRRKQRRLVEGQW